MTLYELGAQIGSERDLLPSPVTACGALLASTSTRHPSEPGRLGDLAGAGAWSSGRSGRCNAIKEEA